jgi:ADP-heptose:LPS heptosyltransferase
MNVLISRTDAIGDTILTLPMANAIKSQYPDAKVYFLVRPLVAPVLQDHEFVDDVFCLEGESKLNKIQFCKKLILDLKIDHYIYVGGDFSCAIAATLCGVSHRAGLLSRWPSFLTLNRGTRQRRSSKDWHEVQFNLELLIPLLGNGPLDNWQSFSCGIRVQNEESGEQANIVIHPGMTGHTLNWPSSHYANLITGLLERYGDQAKVCVSYTPSDLRYIEPIKKLLGERLDEVHFINGAEKGLRNYMEFVAKAKAFVAPSTGTLHIAAALGVPTIGIYSPIRAQCSLRWAPFNPKNTRIVTLSPKVELLKEGYDESVMAKVPVEDIMEHVNKFMEQIAP